MHIDHCVPVAQLDRVAPSEGEGQAFESPQGRQALPYAY